MGPVFGSDSLRNVPVAARKPHAEGGERLFEAVLLPPYRCWRAFVASTVFHCWLVLSLPALGRLFSETDEEILRRQAFVVRPLELRVPDQMYQPWNSPGRGRAGGVSKARARPGGARRKSQGAKLRSKKSPARRFQLPELPRKADVSQTILQPQFPPDLPLQQQVRLPNVIFWSKEALQVPRPAPRRFIEPGRRPSVAAKVPVLEAPPKLELPNQELSISDLRMSGGVITEQPALPRPPATTMPIRVFQAPTRAPAVPEEVSIDAFPGDPANLIAFSSNPSPPERLLSVPAGNQLGRLPGPPREAETGDTLGLPGGGDAEGTGEHGSSTTASSSGSAGSGAGPTGADASGQPGGTGGAGAGSAGGSGAGGIGGSGAGGAGGFGAGGADQGRGQMLALSLPRLGLTSAVPIRTVHPVNAVFDIVVQSSSSGALPDTTGLLSGKPVYTVYLQVGTQKDWALQYCRPAESERALRAAGNVVELGSPPPIKAPYPLVTVIPPFALQPGGDYLMVHGFLEPTGRFKALRLVQESSRELREQLFPFLEQWEFRPGTRDGLPVLLEILLMIPPQA